MAPENRQTMASPKWSLGPLQLIATPKYLYPEKDDPFHAAGTAMAVVHNAFVRAYNNIYHICHDVPKSDYHNFVSYCYTVYTALQNHHDEEENTFFPVIERLTGEKGIMETNVQQHAAFESGHSALGSYLKDLLDTGRTSEFQPEKLQNLIDSFAEPLSIHLSEEIDTLLALSRYPKEVIEVAAKEGHAAAMKAASFTETIPMMMLNHDMTYEGGIHGNFPPMPAPVSLAMRKLTPVYYWGRWKYTSCDTNQIPRQEYSL